MRMRTIGISLALFASWASSAAEQAQAADSRPAQGTTPAPAAAAQGTTPAPAAAAPAARPAAPAAPAPAMVDRYIGPIRTVGQREIGRAAWYGSSRHLGRRTASGEPLDGVRATAAHRSLPLYSLARVTNLKNGRTVVVTVNDRGPVSHSLAIDLSPRAAQLLDMFADGVVPVAIEPVARVAGMTTPPAGPAVATTPGPAAAAAAPAQAAPQARPAVAVLPQQNALGAAQSGARARPAAAAPSAGTAPARSAVVVRPATGATAPATSRSAGTTVLRPTANGSPAAAAASTRRPATTEAQQPQSLAQTAAR